MNHVVKLYKSSYLRSYQKSRIICIMYRAELKKYLSLNIGNACLMLRQFSGGENPRMIINIVNLIIFQYL